MRHHWHIGMGLTAAIFLGGCESWNDGNGDRDAARPRTTSSGDKPMATTGTLYERLGGEPAVRKVTDDFVARAASNPNVNFFRKNVPGAEPWAPTDAELAEFKERMVQWVSRAAGAPVQYEGRDMRTVHKGMKITDQQFDAAVADLKATLDKLQVPEREKRELLAAVGQTRTQIVEVKQ
jgi:hemoglobin